MSFSWYVLHTQTSWEQRVEVQLRRQMAEDGDKSFIKDIFIPTENISEVRDGKKRVSTRKFFPGYVLICMEMTDENWYFIRQIPGVSKFVGAAKQPLEVSAKEVEKIIQQSEEKKEKLQPKVSFEEGENIKIIEGPFLSFTGLIQAVFPDKGKLRVMVSIFGRSTPVELEYWQVEKM